jgi:hypothetical protein
MNHQALQLIDLRDPRQPEVHAIEDVGSAPVLDGEHLYFTTTQAVEGSAPQRQVRHFVHSVALSGQGAFRPSEPVNVPGALLTIDSGTLFLADAQWDGTMIHHFIRKVALDDQGAWVVASQQLDEPVVSARVTAAGQLAVVTGEQGEDGYNDVRLSLLATDDLTVLGSAEGPGLRIAGQSGDTLVIEAGAGGGLELWNIADPTQPSLDRTLVAARLIAIRDHELVYVRSTGSSYVLEPGALRRLELP